jgi:Poly (ADP-ribose) glycohydrolase (PARG)
VLAVHNSLCLFLRKIGGGVIGKGCVQEEIRFITCPELIVARLFVEQLADNEALVVQGFEQFADYEGYQDTFKCKGGFYDDPEKVQKRVLVAIDALDLPQILKDQKTVGKYKSSLVNILKQVLMV